MKLEGSKLLDRVQLDALIAKGLNYVHFSPALEPTYRQQYKNEAAYEFRFRGPIIFFLYAFLSYGIFQVLPDGEITRQWFSYYGWVGVIILGAWVLSFFKAFNPYFDLYTCLGSMGAVAISFIIIPIIGKESNDALLHAAMMYAVVIIYGFVGMRFYTAFIAGWVGGLIAIAVTLWLHFDIDWTALNRTYTFSSILGMSLAYAIDRQHRENYLQNCIIALNQQEMTQQAELLELLSHQDPLTGLANRRYLNTVLDKEWRWAVRFKKPVTVMMIDIDYFKNYNDSLGHVAGDRCLQQIATVLSSVASRSKECAARYGGEEFMLVFPMTSTFEAKRIADLLIQRIGDLEIPHPSSSISSQVTISLGIVTIVPQMNDQLTEFINKADQTLYEAKSQGRNRYKIAS